MKIRNRRKCLDYQMNTKEILEYPLLPPCAKIKRPYNFFFTLVSASMQQNDLMNCTGMYLCDSKASAYLCPFQFFESIIFRQSTLLCVYSYRPSMLNKVRHAGASVSLLGTLCFYF